MESNQLILSLGRLINTPICSKCLPTITKMVEIKISDEEMIVKVVAEIDKALPKTTIREEAEIRIVQEATTTIIRVVVDLTETIDSHKITNVQGGKEVVLEIDQEVVKAKIRKIK